MDCQMVPKSGLARGKGETECHWRRAYTVNKWRWISVVNSQSHTWCLINFMRFGDSRVLIDTGLREALDLSPSLLSSYTVKDHNNESRM